jgi:hypothetical protein
MLIFLSGEGEGECGKTYLVNIIYNMLLMNGLEVKKLATTGYAATLIDGQTIYSYLTINHLSKSKVLARSFHYYNNLYKFYELTHQNIQNLKIFLFLL